FFFFFFSSRRRHTRFDCDWSSDVCSSDLSRGRGSPELRSAPTMAGSERGKGGSLAAWLILGILLIAFGFGFGLPSDQLSMGESRSEERRVGKECRSRWGR